MFLVVDFCWFRAWLFPSVMCVCVFVGFGVGFAGSVAGSYNSSLCVCV